MTDIDFGRYRDLDFDAFEQRARDPRYSKYEKIGFPDSYRAGREDDIFQDILHKLPTLNDRGKCVMDIGPGCSDLPIMLADLCQTQGHQLILVDAPSMLSLLPDRPFITKIPGQFPQPFLDHVQDGVDVILCYSVFHYVYAQGSPNAFIDRAISLLKQGGMMLLGDIPNQSKRRRFFGSDRGIAFHKAFMKTDEPPVIGVESDDSPNDVDIIELMKRIRKAGCDSYILPQPPHLPMANRREDILIARP